MHRPKHSGYTLDDWERRLKGVEDITPRVRRWGIGGYLLLLLWGVVFGLLIYCRG